MTCDYFPKYVVGMETNACLNAAYLLNISWFSFMYILYVYMKNGVFTFYGFFVYEWYGWITYVLPRMSWDFQRRNGRRSRCRLGRLGHGLGMMIIPRNTLSVIQTPVGVVITRGVCRRVLDGHD